MRLVVVKTASMVCLLLACGGRSHATHPGSTSTMDPADSGGSTASGSSGAAGQSPGGGYSGQLSGGVANFPSSAGVDAAAGAPPACPVEPTLNGCPEALRGTTCSYSIGCSDAGEQHGEIELAFDCDGSAWSVVPAPCDRTCLLLNASFDCVDGSWGKSQNSELASCPLERPDLGERCGSFEFATPQCGYLCDDGATWTIASCRLSLGANDWVFDGACPGDCGAEDAALFRAVSDVVFQGPRCETDEDCVPFVSRCALTPEHCSGAFYVGKSTDFDMLDQLDAALEQCAAQPGSTWECSTCDESPPPGVCLRGMCSAGMSK
jgi:hypothetical protein